MLFLFAQDPAAAEVGKLLAGVEALLADPVKNADELDRRFVAVSKVLEANPEVRSRDAALGWLQRLARKTGRPAEALSISKERLKSKTLDPRNLEGAYYQAVYSAALALKPDEVISLVRTLAQEVPRAHLASLREDVERDARNLGRPGPSVTTPAYDGSKAFSWGAETKDKIVILYFTASW